MTPFEQLWHAGLETARLRTRDRPGAAAIADRLEQVSFPAAVTVLAGPGREGHVPWTDVLPGLAEHVAGTRELQRRGLSAAQVAEILQALFAEGKTPSGLPGGVAEPVIREALKRQGLDVTDDELRELLALLESGKFFTDLATSAGAVVETIPEVPLALIADVMRTPALLEALPRSGAHDLASLPTLLAGLATTLFDRLRGRRDAPPPIEPHVLGTLYATHSLRTVRRLLSQLLRHDNRTVRLALILYARSNHVAVSDSDIDLVYTHLVRREQPDLAPVLERAIVVMAQRYAPADPETLDRALAFLRVRGAA